MKPRRLLLIILCIYFATSCSPNVTSVPKPTATVINTPTAVATNTPDPLVAQKAAMLYQQDFESGIPTGIESWWGTKWDIQTEVTGNHVFCNVPSDKYTGGNFGTATWGDYAVQMKVKFQEFLSDKPSVAANIRRNQGSSEGYSGLIDLYYGVANLFFGEPYVELGLSPFVPKLNTWYTMRVEAAGNLFKYYIDQQLMAEKTDDHRQQGSAGFTVSPQTKVCVDDIRVWALTKDGSIAQAPTQLPASAAIPNKTVAERLNSQKFPKLFILNQLPAPSDAFINQAAYRDIIVLDFDTVTTRPDYLGASGIIRRINPNAIILAGLSAASTFMEDPNYIRSTFISQIKPEWYMKDIYGKPYHLEPQGSSPWTLMFNLSTGINTFMPDFLANNVMNTGLVDGIYFDWIHEVWSAFKYRTDNPPNSQMDINSDGIVDSDVMINTMMADGTRKMLNESRKVFPVGSLIAGNTGDGVLAVGGNAKTDDTYLNLLNGRMLEAFLSNSGSSWLESMRSAALMEQASSEPRMPLFLAQGTENGFDHLRYTLANALMFDGYFTMTQGTSWFIEDPYTASWWYDEYAVDIKTGKATQSLDAKGYLGLPLSDGYNADNKEEMLKTLLLNNDPRAEYKVWRRDFQNGIVLVNPSGNKKTIDLHGTYRKILGVKDPKFNDGSTVTEVTLLPQSGIILLNMP